MKVLIIANSDVGLYKFRKELLEKIRERHQIYVSVPEGEFIDEIKDIGCEVLVNKYLERRGTNLLHDIVLIRHYDDMLKRYRPDIVLTYTIKPNVYGGIVSARNNVPYVANITGLGSAVENSGILQKITLVLYRYGLRNAQKVFFQNTENLMFMRHKKVVKKNYKLLPGSGVNLKQYHVLEYPCGSTVDFVFIARIMREKGIEEYLSAAEYIRKKYTQTRFHVCGICEERYKERLKELHMRNIIIYHGMVHDMRKIYEICSCTVHPSFYPEGISNVLLESAASARPIITTARAGCREVVEDGMNGYLVRERDSKDLISKIEKFMNLSQDEKKRMGMEGRKKVEEQFDRQIIIDEYLKELFYTESKRRN